LPTPYSEAAKRMFRDAESLYEAGRLGTPDHLYGLAGECALKAVLCGYRLISGTKPQRHFKVHISQLWDEYLAHVHGRGMPSLGLNPFTEWQTDHRYENDSLFTRTRVSGHRKGALEGMKAMELAAERGLVS
jgi:hypothetical protein